MPKPDRQLLGPTTLVDLLRHRADRQADDRAYTFLVDGESEEAHLTYGELDRQARASLVFRYSPQLYSTLV